MIRPSRAPSRAALAAAAMASVALATTAFVAVAPVAPAWAATRLYVANHVASNDIRAAASWGGSVALATGGGVVLADSATGATSKILSRSGGVPSNNLLSIAASPAGYLWLGTADQGLARMRPDGSFLRTLTSFDGLPSDRVQAIYRSGDSLWVATSGGAALFAEDPVTGQATLRRSDSRASTGGGLASDDVTSFASWNDTLWCGTNAGLSAFVAGAWIPRTSIVATRIQSLLVANDTLWIGTTGGLRLYAGGATVARGTSLETLALAALPWGVGRATPSGPFLLPPDGSETPLGTGGLPIARTQALLATPASRVFAGTTAGLGRYDGGGTPWSAIRSDGPATNGGVRVSAARRNVWVALGNVAPPGLGAGTILRYGNGAWSYVDQVLSSGQLQGASSFGLLAAADGTLWVGHCCSNAAGDSRPRTDRWNPAADAWTRPAGYNLFDLTEGPAGRTYGVGVEYENGVYVFDASSGALLDSLTPVNTDGGLTRNNLRSIAFDAAGRGWIATADNGVDRWDGRGTSDHADDLWTHFGNGFSNLQTTSVATIAANEAWVGTRAGAVRILNDVVDAATTSKVNAALQNAAVNDLAVDGDGAVWIATAGGLARVSSSGTIEEFTTDDGLASNDVQALAWEPEREILWAVTAGGVSEIHPSPEGRRSFDDGSYVYPNPVAGPGALVKLGGISGAIAGEIRDLSGAVIHRFEANPVSPAIWDLRDGRGSAVASGVYLVVLRQGDLTRVLKLAVTR